MAGSTAPPAIDAAPIDGEALRGLLVAGTTWLARNAAAVNALNVFPVPDGDTGTNMLLTMRAAVEAAAGAQSTEPAEVMRAAAQGAVLGARGNSGVILSQIIAGIARGLAGVAACDGPALAKALAEGAATAYRAVARPVEGTILTVARAAGDGALARAAGGQGEPSGRQGPASCREVLECALSAAREAVERTPDQLALLRQAGVVDAGGEGYRLILEGIALALRGEPLPAAPTAEQPAMCPTPAAERPASWAAAAMDTSTVPDEAWGYCTQFVVRGERLDREAIARDLQALAQSALVVGDESLVRVHGHTGDPGRLLSYAVRHGRLQRISIEDMDAQHDDWLRAQVAATPQGSGACAPSAGAGEARPPATGIPDSRGEPAAPAAAVATVAVAPGPGWADVFRSLGTSRVVPGGQTMNPSAQDILAAARRTRAPAVVVLPNNGNVVMTAQHAAGLAASGGAGGPRLVVVPTRTVPQGIAAQLAFNPEAGADANAAAMAAAAAGVRTVEITRATRSVTLQDRVVNQGDVLGLLDGELVAAGPDALAAARQALERAGAGGADLITVYRGAAVAAADADAFVAALRATYPSTEIELVSGGQPHYDYVISAE